MRLKYLKEHRRVSYINLLTSGTLHKHLADVEEEANTLMETLIKQIAISQGINEQLKATNQMAWVGAMNNIQQSAREIVLNDIIYQ